MKNKFLIFFSFIFLFGYTNTYSEYINMYYNESINVFITSPSAFQINNIKDEKLRYCEQVYLEATRRREYTDVEIKLCSDIFKVKLQQELDYKNYVLGKRGIY